PHSALSRIRLVAHTRPVLPDTAPPPRPFFFNDPATTEIYTLSLHDALPIFVAMNVERRIGFGIAETLRILQTLVERQSLLLHAGDRKSTRLNSSHDQISYAVFCLKKKKRLGRGRPHTVSPGRSSGLAHAPQL